MANFYDGQDIDYPTKKEQKTKKLSKITGFCLACNTPIDKGIYCDSWCKEDHEFEIKMKKVLGKP